MLESLFGAWQELTAQQKEGIGELCAVWLLILFFCSAAVMLRRYRRDSDSSVIKLVHVAKDTGTPKNEHSKEVGAMESKNVSA